MTRFVVSLLPFAVLALLWVVFVGRLQRGLARESNVEQSESQVQSLEPGDVWSPSGPIHFRDPEAGEGGPRRFFRSALFPLAVIVVLVAAAAGALGSLTWEDAKGLGSALFFFAVLCIYGLLQEHHSWCREIRLSDDGTCELETKRRVVRLHVNEIQSVKYSRGDESESYTIRYQGGKLHVSERIAGFANFLAHLKTLNPSVELIGFSADAWSDLGPATRKRGDRMKGFFRAALFPLIVIALLVYLASQTFLGK